MKYLVKTLLENKGDKNDIYLGTWCFSKPCLGINSNYNIISYIWSNKYKHYQHATILKDKSERLFEKFCQVLNEVHGECLDERYWGVLLKKWFTDYLSSYYSRYLTVKELIKEHKDISYTPLNIDKFEIPLGIDCADKILESDLYNEQLYTQILNNDYINNIKFT